MGNTFYQLLYFHTPLTNNTEEEELKIKKLKSYKEFKNIIALMREDNSDKRISSAEAYELIEKEYFKILKNSSIFSLITCLNSFKDFNDSLKKIQQDDNKKEKISITNSYKNFLGFLNEEKHSDYEWDININNFRKNLCKLNLKFEGTNEIKPSFLFTFIFE